MLNHFNSILLTATIFISTAIYGAPLLQADPPLRDTGLINLHGIVLTAQQEKISGATIRIKGTHRITTTDDNGEFSFKAIGKNSVLAITAVNIETQEIGLNGRSSITIIAAIKIKTEEEVVVNTGYQNIPKERATGSFTQIDKELVNRSVSVSIIERLRGVANGLSFNTSGARGEEAISIRGRTTLFSNADPLIVVDNFPYEGDINNINPNDVLNMTILKDAAAASIWGARAANGVIVITTKRGSSGQSAKVEFNANVTMRKKPDVFYVPKMSTAAIISVEKMLFDNGFYNNRINDIYTYPALSPVVEILLAERNQELPPEVAAQRLEDLKSIDNRNDLRDYSHHNALHQQYAVNFSGGTKNSTYFFSTGYDRGIGSLKDNSERITINMQNALSPVKDLQITLGVNYITGKTNAGRYPVTASIYPYERLVDDNGIGLVNTGAFRSSYISQLLSQGFVDWSFNPAADALLTNNTALTTDARISAAIKYQLFGKLDMEGNYQFQKQSITGHTLYHEDAYFTRDLINQFSQVDINNVVVDRPVPLGKIMENASQQAVAHNGRLQMNYSNNWKVHALHVLAGFEARQVINTSGSNTIYGYDDELLISKPVNFDSSFITFPYFLNSNIDGAPTNDSYLIDRFASWFANGSYTLDNKYTFSASGRVDQSNYFGVKANQRAVPLWSAGVKWTPSREKFYRVDWLASLNLRATYGYNGNINKRVTALTTMRYLLNNAFNLPYARIVNPENPDLRWERTSVMNIGIDFSTRRHVLSGSIEYYTKKGLDIFGDAPIDGSTGILNASGDARFSGNVANMKGRGVDVQITTRNISRQFGWTTDVLFNYNEDKVTNYTFLPTVADLLVGSSVSPIEGKPVFGVYSYQWAGLDNTGDPQGFLDKEASKDYAKLNNPTIGDLVYHGRARPLFFGSVRNSFSWKGFSLSAVISYKGGYYFRRTSINYASLFNVLTAHGDYEKRWQNPGDELNTYVPAMKYPAVANRETFYNRSAVLVERGDHIRWQDLQFSYTCSGKPNKHAPFSQIRIYSYLSNLGIIWKANKHGIDPDFQQVAPAPFTAAVGVNAVF